MSTAALLRVEVAYATPERQLIVPLQVSAGTTALQAAQQSHIATQFPEIVLQDGSRLGIFGHVVAGSQVLRDGDRVEIYRPLIADPKEVRKARAARAKERRAQSDSTSKAE